MKIRIAILAALLAALLLAPMALAADLPLVVDQAELLTSAQLADLTKECTGLSGEYGMDVVILTVHSLDGKTSKLYAADYYDEKGYGQGTRRDGVIFLVSDWERDMAVATNGRAINAVTDYAREAVFDDIQGYFSRGDYAGGLGRYLHDLNIVLKQAKEGAPYDVNNHVQLRTPLERVAGMWFWALAASLLIAGAGFLILKSGMNTARPQRDAGRYVKDGSMAVGRASDIFLYHTQTRVRTQSNSSGGRGGSSTFRSSGGGTHGGGSRKF